MSVEVVVSLIMSIFSLSISGVTAWLTLFRRGRLAMTKPSLAFFGFDAVPKPTAKIFLRTLLYSTAVRGQVIEAMFAKLQHEGSEQVFSFWGYGETNQLAPGSGLYVGQTGIAANHHFILSVHQPDYEFIPGDYSIEVFSRLVGRESPIRLIKFELSLSREHADILARHGGVLFELNPDGGGYLGHVSERG
ncbi:hypothetical protein [Inquilinus sp. CA228]|uniref:hypothetical protein n=1 Tax=Inquilinus sp. CA228 TaxID=3455609 RepID=UPI003F8D67F1